MSFWFKNPIWRYCDFFYRQVPSMYLRYGVAPIPQTDYLSGSFLRFVLLWTGMESSSLVRSPSCFSMAVNRCSANWGTDDGWTWSPPFAAAALSALHPLPLYIHPHRKCGRDWNGPLHIRVILRAAACRSGSKGRVREQLHRHGEAEQKKRTDLACLIVMKELITFQVCFWAK